MQLLLYLLGLTLAAGLPLDDQDVKLTRGNCPLFWFHFNGSCYKYVVKKLTWAKAELNCVSQAANLVSIQSLQENTFVMALIKNFEGQHTWIGLADGQEEKALMWSDGSPLNFGDWFPGEPNDQYGNEDCVHTNFSPSEQWNDEQCNNYYTSVCKLCIGCRRELVLS